MLVKETEGKYIFWVTMKMKLICWNILFLFFLLCFILCPKFGLQIRFIIFVLYGLHFTGYSGSDLQALCEEAAMMPIRELGSNILTVKANQVCWFQFALILVADCYWSCKWKPSFVIKVNYFFFLFGFAR